MHANAAIPIARRSQELHYVTAHFRDLQGLRLAPLWAALLLLGELKLSGSVSLSLLVWITFAAAAVIFPWLYWSGRWYQRRHGIVRDPEPAARSGLISILHPEIQPSASANAAHTRGRNAVLMLLCGLWLLPAIFRGRGEQGAFAVLVTMVQIVPRAFYPIAATWPIRLRRLLSRAALLTLSATYIGFLSARVGPWFLLPALTTTLLLLDLYDHWLLQRLLSGRSLEWNYE